jgi:hypothetical protein
MKKPRMTVGALAIAWGCVACHGDSIGPHGVPEDLVPAGFQAKECRFEEMRTGLSQADPTRWQRLVCHHAPSAGSTTTRHPVERS